MAVMYTVEQLSEMPPRELDAVCAEVVLGFEWRTIPMFDGPDERALIKPHAYWWHDGLPDDDSFGLATDWDKDVDEYTADPRAMMEVVERLKVIADPWFWQARWDPIDGCYRATFWRGGIQQHSADAEELPRATVIAAVRAAQTEETNL